MKVANGDILKCGEVVRDVKLNMQRVQFVVDLRALTIARLDV